MEQIRAFDFDTGAETSVQPDAGTPSATNDLITLGFLRLVTGSWASPSAIVAGTGIAFTGSAWLNTWFIQGSGGAVDISANPQIAAGTTVGQRLLLICTSDTNTVKLETGTGITMNDALVMKAGSAIEFEWGGATPGWIEIGRNGLEAA